MSRPITIIYDERARQIIDFKGMQCGKLAPTDIDALIEYKNKAYVFIEVKYMHKEVPLGQRIALERLVQDTANTKVSIAVVCEHNIADTDKRVDLAKCFVRDIYLSTELKWRKPKEHILVRELVDKFFIHTCGGW